MKEGRQQVLDTTARLDNFPEITGFVEQAMAACSLPEKIRMEILLAVDEICTNIIQHAYGGKGGTLRIACRCEEDRFVIETLDTGKPFDEATLPIPDVHAPVEERPIGGLGLFLARKILTDLGYERDETGRNHWRMVKCFQ